MSLQLFHAFLHCFPIFSYLFLFQRPNELCIRRFPAASLGWHSTEELERPQGHRMAQRQARPKMEQVSSTQSCQPWIGPLVAWGLMGIN